MTITSNRRRFLQGSAVAGGVGALAACGQQSAEEQAEQQAQDNEQAADEASQLPNTGWERAEYEEVEDGGTLRLAISQLPNTWNYGHVNGALGDLATIRYPLGQEYELVAAEDGTVEVNPDYIVSAEITSEEPQIVSVQYNPDAVWDDGTPITIQDLYSEWQARNGENDDYEPVSTTGWAEIADIRETDDEFTGEIEFATQYADWLTVIHPDIPESVSGTPEAFNDEYVDTPTPSKGPFTVANIDETGGVVTLEPNEHWWGRPPKLESIILSVVSQQQMPSTFANGEIDVVDIADGDTYSQADGRSDSVIQTTNGLTWTHLTMNTRGEGPLSEIEVREAMARAINRDAIGQAVVGPLDAPVVLVNEVIFMPGQNGYIDAYEAANGEPLAFDPDAAGQILDDAGWELNGDVREKDGETLSLSITVPADTASNSDRARQIQTDLNAVGFEVELTTVPADAYFDEYIDQGDFELVTFSWIGTLFPQTSGINLYYPVDSGQNYTGLDLDADLEDSVGSMRAELDEDARITASNQFSEIVLGGYAVIPFYATPEIWGITEGIVNYGPALFEKPDWTAVGFRA